MDSSSLKNWSEKIPVKIFLPVVLTVALFVSTTFFLILPLFEEHLMAGKREVILSLTDSAWSVLNAFAEEEKSGRLSREEAQVRAITQLRQLRYGPEAKDYFWINDMQPRLIMHPYRRDLEGTNIADFSDPSGKRLFSEFVKTVKRQKAGYVDYLWQWKDDPQRIVPKISYVRGFEPWGWIIGTGIYVEDVRTEIASITRRLVLICLAITAVIVGLSGYVLWQGQRVDNQRRKAENSLRKSEEKYRLLAETTDELILTTELEGRITYANRAWLKTCGYPLEDALRMTIADIVPDDFREDLQNLLDRRLSNNGFQNLHEIEFLTFIDERIPVEITVSLLKEGDQSTGFLITARDMTERKKAAELSRNQQEQLFQASKLASIGTLVSGVAHEINNPIASVLLNAPIIEKVWQSTEPILDEYHRSKGDFQIGGMDYSRLRDRMPQLITGISDGALRVKKIVSDLKDFSRKSPPEMSDMLNINRAVEKAVSLVSNLVKKSTDRFELHYQSNMPSFPGNSQRIEQVVINLLVNACQALPEKSRAVFVRTDHDPIAGCVVIEVEDHGIGMDSETIKQITDPFFTTKRDSGGTGLGLAISDRIVRDHGGTLKFFSDADVGTTARVTLPIGGGSPD